MVPAGNGRATPSGVLLPGFPKIKKRSPFLGRQHQECWIPSRLFVSSEVLQVLVGIRNAFFQKRIPVLELQSEHFKTRSCCLLKKTES